MLVLMGKFGRMGNQLWTYANVLAYALEHRISLINPRFEFSELFVGTARTYEKNISRVAIHATPGGISLINFIYKVNLRLRLFPFVQLGEDLLLDLDDSSGALQELGSEGIKFLSGFYFRATKSMENNSLAVRSFFSPVPHLQRRIDDLVMQARNNSDVLVGVHIRHGDYKTYCDGMMYYTIDEYMVVMRSIVDQLPKCKVKFLVCSDESHDLKCFADLDVYQSNCEAVVDMYALGMCDFIFGPNSSFSHWASFYGHVPLHVLNWRAEEIHHFDNPVRKPILQDHFSPFLPSQFGKYAARRVEYKEVVAPSFFFN